LRGDTIIAVDEQPVDFEHGLAELIAGYAPGDTVTLTVKSPNEEARDVTVQLDEHPDKPGETHLGVQFRPFPHVRFFPGERIRPGQPPFGRHLFRFPHDGVQRGVFIRQVAENSPAASAGLSERDIITAIDGEPINTPPDLVPLI
jgi:S1-C subfamily serine protease